MAPATLVESPNIIRVSYYSLFYTFLSFHIFCYFRIALLVRNLQGSLLVKKNLMMNFYRITTLALKKSKLFVYVSPLVIIMGINPYRRRQDLNKIRPVSSTKKVISEIIKPNEHDTKVESLEDFRKRLHADAFSERMTCREQVGCNVLFCKIRILIIANMVYLYQVIRKLQNIGSLGIFFILFDIISRCLQVIFKYYFFTSLCKLLFISVLHSYHVFYRFSLYTTYSTGQQLKMHMLVRIVSIVCYNSSHIFLLFLCSFRTSLMQCTKPKRFTVKFTTRHFIVIINDSINTYQGSSRVCFQPYEFKQIEKIITDKLSGSNDVVSQDKGIIFDCLFPNFCCFKSIRFNHISLFIKLIINVYF
uniref:Transmembrane protein n=1 Tax=Heterorhabditis bacteriophora TaxID=37862 RepID=A0A1I7WHN7_HETBA